MILKHGLQMWQLNIPTPWEISSVGVFSLFITKLPSAIFHTLPPTVSQSPSVLHVTAETAVLWYLYSHEGVEEQCYQLTCCSSCTMWSLTALNPGYKMLLDSRVMSFTFCWIPSVCLCGCLHMLMYLCITRTRSVKCHFGKNVQFWSVKL